MKSFRQFFVFMEAARMCVCVCVCVCLRRSTMKALSVLGWNSRGQINDVVLKTFCPLPSPFITTLV